MNKCRKGLHRMAATLATWWLAAGVVVCAVAAERPSAGRLLPDTTVAMLSVVDVPEMSSRFLNTALGRISQDPQIKPLVGQLYSSLSDLYSEAQDRTGLTLGELLALPQGEFTVALVGPKDGAPAVVIIMDAGAQISKAQVLLERISAVLDQAGVKKSEEMIRGTKVVMYDGIGPQQSKIAFFEKDATVVFGTDTDVVKQILAVWNGAKSSTLFDNRHYASLMSRGGEGESPQILVFVDPVGFMRALAEQNPGLQMVVALLPALGLDGLTALGGTIALDAGQFDSIMRAHLLLETPRSGVVKMIALEPGEVKPERWVPADAATYTTFHWDFDTTYKTLATVYDGFRGEGALARDLGRWFSLRADVDFEKEILPSLEGRVTMFTWIEQPVTLNSQGQLWALRLKNTDLASKALEKLVAKYPDTLAIKSYAGATYYQVQTPALGQKPPRGPRPEPCIGILDGYLMLADRTSIVQQAANTLGGGATLLADDLEFKLILGKIQRQSQDKPAMIRFNRPEESLRYMYDLVSNENTRQQLRRAGGNNRVFKAIDAALQQNPLPPFEALERYLAPGGALLIDDDSGLHYTDFSLRRK